jgi:hypothetical protein
MCSSTQDVSIWTHPSTGPIAKVCAKFSLVATFYEVVGSRGFKSSALDVFSQIETGPRPQKISLGSKPSNPCRCTSRLPSIIFFLLRSFAISARIRAFFTTYLLFGYLNCLPAFYVLNKSLSLFPPATIMMLYGLLSLLPVAVAQDTASTSYGSTAAYASSTASATTMSVVTHTIDVAKASIELFETQCFAN